MEPLKKMPMAQRLRILYFAQRDQTEEVKIMRSCMRYSSLAIPLVVSGILYGCFSREIDTVPAPSPVVEAVPAPVVATSAVSGNRSATTRCSGCTCGRHDAGVKPNNEHNPLGQRHRSAEADHEIKRWYGGAQDYD